MSSKIIAGTTSGTALNMSADTSGILEIQTGSTPTTAISIDASQVVTMANGVNLATTAGNVGIGTASPTDKLTIVENGQGTVWNGGAVNTPSIILDSGITGGGYSLNGINFSANSARSFIYNYSASVTTGNLAFGTVGTERMRIDSSGGVRINATAYIGNAGEKLTVVGSGDTAFYRSSGSNGVGTCFHVNRDGGTGNFLYFTYGAGQSPVGSINTNGSTTAYSTTSDYRLKENIAPMTGALDVVQQLKPVTYTWKSDGSSGQGFIAHELQTVVPDCVTGEKDAVDAEGKPVYQGIDTSFLVATLTAAIQELNAKVEALETKLGATL